MPSAFHDSAAFLLAKSAADAGPTIYALKQLGIRTIYTIGYKLHNTLAEGVTPLTSVEDMVEME